MFTLRKQLYGIKDGTIKPKNRVWVVVALISAYVGYQHGKHNSHALNQDNMVVFQGQDEQVYRLLESKPVLQLFYTPGDPFYEIFRAPFIESSNKFKEAHFMFVNCSVNYQYCRNIDFPRMPMALMTLPQNYEQSKLKKFRMEGLFPQVEYLKDYTVEGVNYFLQENGVIPQQDYSSKWKQQITDLVDNVNRQ